MKKFCKTFLPSISCSLILGILLFGWNSPIAAAQQTAPLTYAEITTALNTKLPNKYFKTKADLINWLIGEIKTRKVDRPLTDDRQADLRQIGATDQLIEIIRTNSPTFKNPSSANPPYRIEFVKIPAGSFSMGSNSDTANYFEKPVHKVTITKEFWMQKTEVTQAQWKAFMVGLPTTKCFDENRADDFLGDNKPVFCVSWENVQEFIRRLNAKKDGFKYRLPTEAEWEYAARAGATGDNNADLRQIAWFGMDESDGHPYDVATKKPNAWGLYDMIGNVSEWVSDWYDEKYYPASPATDPTGPPIADERLVRGGAWASGGNSVNPAARIPVPQTARNFFIGFRLVREK